MIRTDTKSVENTIITLVKNKSVSTTSKKDKESLITSKNIRITSENIKKLLTSEMTSVKKKHDFFDLISEVTILERTSIKRKDEAVKKNSSSKKAKIFSTETIQSESISSDKEKCVEKGWK